MERKRYISPRTVVVNMDNEGLLQVMSTREVGYVDGSGTLDNITGDQSGLSGNTNNDGLTNNGGVITTKKQDLWDDEW